MTGMLVLATLLTVPTLVLALPWRLALALRRRPAPSFWWRALKWNATLFALHLLVTAPVLVGFLLSRPPSTRDDERDYSGPRIAADGTWLVQSRESLHAEATGASTVEPSLAAAASKRAVSFTASDGVRLRGFLVAPASEPGDGTPRFTALLTHGWSRGALEIEVVGNMFRKLGGEVLLLEMRNHGGSDRTGRLTWGRDESRDVLAAVEFLRSRPGMGDRPLILFGVSGGSTAVALAAPRVSSLGGVVLDAPIDDLHARARGLLPEPWATTVYLSVGHIGRVPVHEVEPMKSMQRLPPSVVVLLIGAGHDARVPPDSVRAYYEALSQPEARKRVWIEPEATHGKVWFQAPEEYARQLAWLWDNVVTGPGPMP